MLCQELKKLYYNRCHCVTCITRSAPFAQRKVHAVATTIIFVLALATLVAVGALVALWVTDRRTIFFGIAAVLAVGLVAATSTAFAISAGYLDEGDALFAPFMAVLVVVVIAAMLLPLVTALLCIRSGILLAIREGVGLRNMLSLGVGVAIIVAPFLTTLTSTMDLGKFGTTVMLVITAVADYLLVIAASYIVTAGLNLVNRPHSDLDYVIVLGSGLQGDRVPPLLASRLQRGLKALGQNEQAKLVVSGGKGDDEHLAEGEAMARWVRERGVADDKLIVENRSRNTNENLAFSYSLILADAQARGLDHHPRIAVVSNSYHVLRALLEARSQHIPCIGYGAPTKMYFSLNALVREFIGYLWLMRRAHFAGIALVVIVTIAVQLVAIKSGAQ